MGEGDRHRPGGPGRWKPGTGRYTSFQFVLHQEKPEQVITNSPSLGRSSRPTAEVTRSGRRFLEHGVSSCLLRGRREPRAVAFTRHRGLLPGCAPCRSVPDGGMEQGAVTRVLL